MNQKSRTKLTEECGELVTVLAKIDAFGSTGLHWDGKGSLITRLEDEIADVLAAASFAIEASGLDAERIGNRMADKLLKFEYWDEGGRELNVPDEYEPRLRDVEVFVAIKPPKRNAA